MRTLHTFIKQVLSEAYSQGLVNSLIKKFKSGNPALTDDMINYYVQKFDENKDGKIIKSHPKGNDILKYSWSELEKLIDANFSTRSLREPVIETDMKELYKSEDGTLQVFLGDRREKCIKIRQDFEGRTGKQYSWCISRSDASNMFASYRYRAGEPVFYYIFDTDRDLSDPLHACVIYVNSGGKFFLSDARNRGDKSISWDRIVSMMPKLKDLKQIFKPQPLTPRERETYEKIKNKLSDEQFTALTRDEKEDYIGFAHKMSEAQVRDIFSIDRDLVNKYCNMHQRVMIPLDIYRKLPPATQRVIKDGWRSQAEAFEFLYEGKREIEGSLDLAYTHITSLPPGLRVRGSLGLDDTKITSLPEDLEVGESLNLYGTPITSLPKDLKVGVDLNLSKTKITSLPEGLEVGGSLDLAYTPITSLPPGLRVRGSLGLGNTKITSLPPDLKLGGSLGLNGSLITSLPPGLKVGGDLHLNNTKITSLPEGLEVEGSLHLDGSLITSLPPGLKVRWGLYLRNTPITSLPPDLVVGGDLFPEKFDQMYREMKSQKIQAESVFRQFIRNIITEAMNK